MLTPEGTGVSSVTSVGNLLYLPWGEAERSGVGVLVRRDRGVEERVGWV